MLLAISKTRKIPNSEEDSKRKVSYQMATGKAQTHQTKSLIYNQGKTNRKLYMIVKKTNIPKRPIVIEVYL